MKYTLKNDFLSVEFDTFGGALISIKNTEGIEYLWQGDAEYWSGQAPVLFPICGSLRDNKAETLEGKEITMPRHGIVRKLEFNCEKHTQTEIIFSIASNADLLEQYPYDFKLYIQYKLFGNQIDVNYVISNNSESTMPFFIGGHPGFNCPLVPDLEFTDYKVTFSQTESTELPDNQLETGLVDRNNKRKLDFDGKVLPMGHQLFKKDALIFANSNSNQVTLSSDKDKHSVTMTYEDFPNLLIWSSDNDGPFVALEPMVGLSTYLDEDNIFEHKENIQKLESQNSAFYSYQMKFD